MVNDLQTSVDIVVKKRVMRYEPVVVDCRKPTEELNESQGKETLCVSLWICTMYKFRSDRCVSGGPSTHHQDHSYAKETLFSWGMITKGAEKVRYSSNQ